MKKPRGSQPTWQWEIRKQNGMAATQAGCMAVPTSKASEHRSGLNDRINKWWWWGRGRADAEAETRQSKTWRPEPEETACLLPVDGSNILELLPFRTLVIGLSIRPLLCDHMIMHLQQPAPSCSSSPRRPCPVMAGCLMSAVVRPAGNLDRPSWSWCPADV